MAIAVSLSDGKVSNREIESIGRILNEPNLLQKRFAQLKNVVNIQNYSNVVNQLVTASIQKSVSQSLKKADIVNIIRQLIVVAASDSIIAKCELETIYQFSKKFNVSKQEIVLLSKQLGF